MSYDSQKHGTEHYPKGEFDVFKDGKRIEADAVTIRQAAVRERDERHERMRDHATDNPEGGR